MKSVTLTDGTQALCYLEKSPTGVVIVTLIPEGGDYYSSARHAYDQASVGEAVFAGKKTADWDAEAARAKEVSGATIGTDEDVLFAAKAK